MRRQTRGPWATVAGLEDYVFSLIEQGATYTVAAEKASEKFGVSVTYGQVMNKCQRGRSVASVESFLEPAEGFARDHVTPPAHAHPKGWEPHVEENGDTAVAVSKPMAEASPDEASLIRGWNLDPNEWEIVGNLNCRRWQSMVPVIAEGKTIGHEERWLYYYKANLRRRGASVTATNVASLIEEIRTHARLPVKRPEGDLAFVVCLADWQMGKADGDGTQGIVGRVIAAIDSVETRIEELRKIGRKIGSLYVFGLGDLIENCSGFYAQQEWRTQLNRREQINVTRRLILKALERWAPHFKRVVVAAVGGNHGENRKDGKSFTDFADNDDVAIFEQVSDVFKANPKAYGHVSFVLPNDRLSLTLDVCGTVVGITHGHQAGKGSTAQAKLHAWWRDQAHGEQAIGSASILLSGHYHHFSIVDLGAKTHIQCPALDGGSDWWSNVSGANARPGVLTAIVGGGGYSDLEVL